MHAIYPNNFPKCPVCEAKAGAFCRRDNGRSGPHVAPHPARTKAARLDAIRVTSHEATP